MSRPALALPVRTLAPAIKPHPQWTCRRCLATQTETNVDNYDPTLPARQRIGSDGKPYRLKKGDFFLKKPLPQRRIPTAYLQHSTSPILHESEKAQREETVAHRRIVGVVVSSGLMSKTVKVRVAGQTWNKRIGKMFHDSITHLVHDPNSSLVTGDVVELHRLPVSRNVRHVVASIVSPFGTPIEARPAIPTPDERLAAYKERRFAKFSRRELREKAANGDESAQEKLKELGLDVSAEAESASGKDKKKMKTAARRGI